jgi:hypothetical protein
VPFVRQAIWRRNVVIAPEAETSIVSRITEYEDPLGSGVVHTPQTLVDERSTDAAPLSRRSDGERSEESDLVRPPGKHACREDHMADDSFINNSDKRENGRRFP